MQAQARICPFCFDDHLEWNPCNEGRLIEEIQTLRSTNEQLKSENIRLREGLKAFAQHSRSYNIDGTHRKIADDRSCFYNWEACIKLGDEALSSTPLSALHQEYVRALEKVVEAARTFCTRFNVYSHREASLLGSSLQALEEIKEKMK